MVALLEDVAGHGLLRCQVGRVVERLAPRVYEVEFSDDDGRTYATLSLRADQFLQLHHEVREQQPNAIDNDTLSTRVVTSREISKVFHRRPESNRRTSPTSGRKHQRRPRRCKVVRHVTSWGLGVIIFDGGNAI